MSDEQNEKTAEEVPVPGKKPDGRRNNRVSRPGRGGTQVGTPKVRPSAGWGAFSDAWSRGIRSTRQLAELAGCSTKTIKRYIARLEAGAKPDTSGGKITARLEPPLGPTPPREWDPIEVALRAAATDKLPVTTRLQAVRITEERRRWEAEHGEQARVDWATVQLEDIPHEHRARLAGLLAETLVAERAPQLGLAETTEAQATAYYLIGRVLTVAEAEEVVRDILAPAMARALARADELVAERERVAAADRPRDSEVKAEEWLTHV